MLLPRGRPNITSSGIGAGMSVALHVAAVAAIVLGPTVAEHIASFDDLLPQGLSFLVPPSTSPDAASAPMRFQDQVDGSMKGEMEGERTSGFERLRGGKNPGSGASALASTVDVDAAVSNPADEYGEYFTIVDVDSAAVRYPESAAPVYPPELMAKGVEGYAAFRFIVDSSGLIDLATVEVIETSRPEFARAVRKAMPEMRFRPALVGTIPVRQLAEQIFRFKVQPAPIIPLPPQPKLWKGRVVVPPA